jgi:hypothetical protein
MCVDCVLASPRIAQVDPGNEPLPKVVLSHLYTNLCFLPPVRLTLTLRPKVLGTFCCVLFLQALCRMKKLLGGVK